MSENSPGNERLECATQPNLFALASSGLATRTRCLATDLDDGYFPIHPKAKGGFAHTTPRYGQWATRQTAAFARRGLG